MDEESDAVASARGFEDDCFLTAWQQRSLFNVVAMFFEN